VWHVNEKIYAKLKPLFKTEMKNAEGAESIEITPFLERKWKPWKADRITVITSRTEAEYKKNLAKLNEKHEAAYPQIINYINQKVLTPHKEKLMRYWTDLHLH
jgi:beta-lactamase class D